MRVHDSQAYRKMDVTRERISRRTRFSMFPIFTIIAAAPPKCIRVIPCYCRPVSGSVSCDVLGYIAGVSFTVDNGHLMRIGDDLSATNGVVHKIDRVLIPESLKGQI